MLDSSRDILRVCVWLGAAIYVIDAGTTEAGKTAAMAGVAGTTWTDRQKEDFLLSAEITGAEELSIGITRSRRATLSLDGRIHDAHIQTVDVEERNVRIGGRIELVFRDTYRYNVAAYRLDRMLDLRMVPVSVERFVEGRKAAVTWWVDDVLMMEKDRLENRIQPPHPRDWIEQVYRRRIFNELVYNTDFNLSNQLIASDWRIWLIDFTRAFRPLKRLYRPSGLWRVDEPLLERLRALTLEQIDDRLSSCLTRSERRALLARRDLIVRHYVQAARTEPNAAVH